MKSEKAAFWHQHIHTWKNSGLSQAEYCSVNNLSTSNFSKWKKKIAPTAKPKHYRPKSKYSKYTKLTDAEFELLMLSFFEGEEIQATEERTGISAKTISNLYRDLQDQVVSNALIYPHLFFHAGTLLLLGPPPDSQKRLDFYKEEFEHRKNQVRSNEDPKGQLRNNIELSFRLLVNYMSYEWSLAECFVFREVGMQLYYAFIYAEEHGTDPIAWDVSLYKKLVIETNLVNVFVANINYWATVRNGTSYFEEENWDSIFRDRNRRKIDKAWAQSLAHDLQWALKHSPMKGKKKRRNAYWDEFRPDDTAIEEVKAKLFAANQT